MLTVREAVALLSGAKAIRIVWDAYCREVEATNVLDMDAYGDYIVRRIRQGYGMDQYELELAMAIKKREL